MQSVGLVLAWADAAFAGHVLQDLLPLVLL